MATELNMKINGWWRETFTVFSGPKIIEEKIDPMPELIKTPEERPAKINDNLPAFFSKVMYLFPTLTSM